METEGTNAETQEMDLLDAGAVEQALYGPGPEETPDAEEAFAGGVVEEEAREEAEGTASLAPREAPETALDAGEALPADADARTPFLVELGREPDGGSPARFRPSARLVLTPALRTSGLLAALPPERAGDLLLLLTFLTPEGNCVATLPELAAAMGAAQGKAHARMDRLCAFRWRGMPLVVRVGRENGPDAFAPAPALLAFRERPHGDTSTGGTPGQGPPVYAAGREAVVGFSRATYGRPLAQVEAEVLRQLGHAPEEEPQTPEARERADLRQRLRLIGLTADEADGLLDRYYWGDIRQQLAWLPLRRANRPSRMLLAAVEGNFGPPRPLRPRPE